MPEVGSIVRTRNFRHYVTPNPTGPQNGDALSLDYTMEKGKVFVMLYLGAENKDGSDPLPVEGMLGYMGWQRAPDPAILQARARAVAILKSTVEYGGLCTPGANRDEIVELVNLLEADK